MEKATGKSVLVEFAGAVGGWLVGQSLCLSDYHNNTLAPWAFGIGGFLLAMPYLGGLTSYVPDATKDRLRRGAVYLNASVGVVVQVIAILIGILLATHIYRLPKPKETLSQYEWAPLKDPQMKALSTIVRRLPKRRIIVVRSDTPDCAALADEIAAIFEEQSELLVPPYSLAAPPAALNLGHAIVFADPGIQIYAPPNPDNTVKALQAGISEAVNYPVEIGPIAPMLYGNLNPDFVISISAKTPAGFLLSGDVQIEAGARSKTINIKGVSSYTVTASTSWGASANATEIAQDHFVVEFSSPAPPARPAATPTSAAGAIQTATPTAAAITPTPVPLTGQLHWLAFRYP